MPNRKSHFFLAEQSTQQLKRAKLKSINQAQNINVSHAVQNVTSLSGTHLAGSVSVAKGEHVAHASIYRDKSMQASLSPKLIKVGILIN